MIVGIDLGTSMIKAAAFSLQGESLAVASRRPTLRYLSRERIEQDFEEVVTAVGAVVSEVLTATGQVPLAVGITGQSDGLWLLDERGYAVRPAISWLDGRGNAILQRWMDSGVFEAVFRRNANAMYAGCHAPLMAAVAESDPEALNSAATISYLKDAILQRLTGARVIVVGRGDDMDRLQRKAADAGLGDSVLFTGFLADGVMRAVLAECDVFAMPSRGEGFGLVYLEAMRAGIPCIGSTADAAVDIIVQGKTGLLVPAADPLRLARAIGDLLAGEPGRRKMGMAGRHREANVFSFAQFRDRLGAALSGPY